jgi:CheY-like chemotaxis protein
MRKVMLVIDEIQQLVGLESFLRRLGFDVLSLSKESQVADAQLGFLPDVAILSFQGRSVDGVRLSRQMKRQMRPPPRIAICYSNQQPSLTKEDEKSIDALLEIPAAGENAIRLLSQLAGVNEAPLLEKYRKFATARLSRDEQVVIVPGAGRGSTGGKLLGALSELNPEPEWDPKKSPGTSATARSERTNRYDAFLENHSKDLANGAADKVMPRERAAQLMKKLRVASEKDKDLLDKIQAEKIKFAEAMFDDKDKKRKP